MRGIILPNGNLKITASNKERSSLTETYRQNDYYGAESNIADGLHELFTFIRPECIGALTASPILTDKADYCDEAMTGEFGGPVLYEDSSLWWYPEYQVSDPWQELARRGRVVFTKAEKPTRGE